MRSIQGIQTSPNNFKYFIAKGNNSAIVVNMIRQRFWYQQLPSVRDLDEMISHNSYLLPPFIWTPYTNKRLLNAMQEDITICYNKIPNNMAISSKRELIKNMEQFKGALPESYILTKDSQALPKACNDSASIWIVKPGEDSN
jgi:hypothetical protein